MIREISQETVIDCMKMLPFLFAAFLILEMVEHYAGTKLNRILGRVGNAGPAAGALLGCIPQCGFSVVAANLYSGGIITLGTLVAVFLATSDEAILILLSYSERGAEILWLILIKIIIAIIAGYMVDIIKKNKVYNPAQDEVVCTTCDCTKSHKIWMPAMQHTAKIFLYLLIFTFILNMAIEMIGMERLSTYLLTDSLFQPFIAALIGFIPNCASSVILSKLYLSGVIDFASTVGGLCTCAGVGLLVLFKMNPSKADSLKITGLLYAVGVISGSVLKLIL